MCGWLPSAEEGRKEFMQFCPVRNMIIEYFCGHFCKNFYSMREALFFEALSAKVLCFAQKVLACRFKMI
jgi:hypothetical protein